MKVYTVSYRIPYEGSSTSAVFSSRILAEQTAKILTEQDTAKEGEYEVDEYEYITNPQQAQALLNVRGSRLAGEKISQKLDRLASHLESIGMVKEAHDLDVVSNSIDAASPGSTPSYDKYLLATPAKGGEYYSLDIPKDVAPPKEGDRLKLDGVDVVVFNISTPDEIRKGRGGPVAKSMESLGIGWRVNCLPEGHRYLARKASDSLPEGHRFFTADELRQKGRQYAERLYQEYLDSARGKKVFDKALKTHPEYNQDENEADDAASMILEDVDGWLKAMGKSEGEVNLLKSMLKDKILAGIT